MCEPLNVELPVQSIGPLKITGPVLNEEVKVPLATLEKPLWPSTQRGARITQKAGGIRSIIIDERMTRSIILQADNAFNAVTARQKLTAQYKQLADIVKDSSRFAQLLAIHIQIQANLLYLRIEISSGDAAGHNMVTLAADKLITWILEAHPSLRYISISGNYCTDKKVSAVNGILGRGKNVIAESVIPRRLCQRYLKTTPENLVDINIKKNLIGSILAGSLCSANAHFANALLALYLATGQDAANIVEGSQGMTHAELQNDKLYFAVTLPNIIVGTVGNGKELPFAQRHLSMLGCLKKGAVGENARRLAAITAATVLCAELSLLAAQSNEGELMQAHLKLEREKNDARPE